MTKSIDQQHQQDGWTKMQVFDLDGEDPFDRAVMHHAAMHPNYNILLLLKTERNSETPIKGGSFDPAQYYLYQTVEGNGQLKFKEYARLERHNDSYSSKTDTFTHNYQLHFHDGEYSEIRSESPGYYADYAIMHPEDDGEDE